MEPKLAYPFEGLGVTKIKHSIGEQIDIMTNIDPYNKFANKLQESFLTLDSKKRIQFMTQHIDITPGDVLLDVGGNTGKVKRFTQEVARKLWS